VGFDVGDFFAGIGSHGLQCANLIGDHVFQVAGFHLNAASAKAPQVVKTGVCANTDAFFFRILYNASHGVGVACMEATGNVGRTDDFQDGVVVSDVVRTKPFAHIRIKIHR